MTWDHEGQAWEGDGEEARDRAADLGATGYEIQSGLDRFNLVCLIDEYAGAKWQLLVRMAMAGSAVSKLSISRLARDCNMRPRTAERYRSALVHDGIIESEVDDKGRTVFRLNWMRLLSLACHGLERRPVKERIAIIEGTFRRIADHNALPINREWLDYWADPNNTSLPPDNMSGGIRRARNKQNHSPRQQSLTPRQHVGGFALTPDNMSGPSEPESINPNLEPESLNGPLPSGPHHQNGIDPIQETYGGKPTLLVRVLAAMLREGGTWTRRAIIETLDAHPAHVTASLRELRQRGYVQRVGHGRYQLTVQAKAQLR